MLRPYATDWLSPVRKDSQPGTGPAAHRGGPPCSRHLGVLVFPCRNARNRLGSLFHPISTRWDPLRSISWRSTPKTEVQDRGRIVSRRSRHGHGSPSWSCHAEFLPSFFSVPGPTRARSSDGAARPGAGRGRHRSAPPVLGDPHTWTPQCQRGPVPHTDLYPGTGPYWPCPGHAIRPPRHLGNDRQTSDADGASYRTRRHHRTAGPASRVGCRPVCQACGSPSSRRNTRCSGVTR